jgi:2-polyprenyl-6-methoxyphenol hydroxylase-like FAD-dependent oxidoreductase
MAVVCVMGGGPAGSVFAIRMAQLGHQVQLVENVRFPRPHLGESLSPGVTSLLQSVGAEGGLDRSRSVRDVEVAWEGPSLIRRDEHAEGRLVDRGTFDRWLVDHARSLGVEIHQPARVIARRREEQGWCLVIETETGREEVTADFLADARGRGGAGGWNRQATGPATLALHAYWDKAGLPSHPVIKAGEDAWYWAVPLPDGTCNVQVFVDPRQFGASRKQTLAARYFSLLDRSGFQGSRLVSEVMGSDATPFVAGAAATASSLALGEAALALDPLSSSGVAMTFYQTSLEEASVRHRNWATGYYAEAARTRSAAFWQMRAAAVPDKPPDRRAAFDDPLRVAAQPVRLSRDLVIADVPCIEGEFITLKPALRHPLLAGPVAFLGGQLLAPLVSDLRSGATLVEIAQDWSHRMPFRSALSIAMWLRHNGILIDHAEARP